MGGLSILTLSTVAAVAVLLSAGTASAATIYVANNCAGQRSPCTTNLQSALDDTSYATVGIVGSSTFTGDFVIQRTLALRGLSGASLQRESGGTYCLRVEGATNVVIDNVDLTGTLAIYDSNIVTVDDLTITGGDVAVQILDSDDVLLNDVVATASTRAVDVLDTASVSVVDSDLTADSYALVASSSGVTVTRGTITGDSHVFVLQDGNDPRYSTLDAEDATLNTSGGSETTWAWNRVTTAYTGCSPTPTELLTSTADLIDLISYTPYGGG